MNDVTPIAPTRHKLDVSAFYRMAEAGIIGESDRIELIDGELIDMAPIGQDHAGMVGILNETLVLECAGRAIVSVQNPLRVNDLNQPQPDFIVSHRRADYYRTGERAGPADVLLVIEVSDSSLCFDRTVKLGIYARAGLPEYWIVDLTNRAVIIHRQPSGASYGDVRTLTVGISLPLAADPDLVIDLAKIIG